MDRVQADLEGWVAQQVTHVDQVVKEAIVMDQLVLGGILENQVVKEDAMVDTVEEFRLVSQEDLQVD